MPIPLKFKAALDDSAFMAGIRRIKTATSKLGGGIGRGAGRGARGIGGFLGGAAGITGLSILGTAAGTGVAAHKLIKDADALDHLSKKTGIAVSSLAMLQEASSGANIEMEQLAQSVVRMQSNLGNGSKKTQQALDDMGLSFKDLKDKAPEFQFIEIGKALNNMTDQSKKAAAATAIFGKGGSELFDFFSTIEKLDVTKISNHASKIAEAVKVLAPLADQIDAAKFAVAANAMQGLAKGVKVLQHLTGTEPDIPPEDVTITGRGFRDTLGFGRKEQGLNTGRQGFGRLAPSVGGIGNIADIDQQGGNTHSIVRRGDRLRAQARASDIQKEIAQRKRQTELLEIIKDQISGMADTIDDNFE